MRFIRCLIASSPPLRRLLIIQNIPFFLSEEGRVSRSLIGKAIENKMSCAIKIFLQRDSYYSLVRYQPPCWFLLNNLYSPMYISDSNYQITRIVFNVFFFVVFLVWISILVSIRNSLLKIAQNSELNRKQVIDCEIWWYFEEKIIESFYLIEDKGYGRFTLKSTSDGEIRNAPKKQMQKWE